jgi:two-component system, NtrC family, response regulator AlgB
MRIILIDDDLNFRRVVVPVLKGMGYDVVAAANWLGAMRELETNVFDVAFLDLRLGHEDGLELMPKLVGAQPQIAVVIITGYATIETAVQAIRRGAFDYLAKPFSPEQMQQVLMNISRARRLESKAVAPEPRLLVKAPTPIFESADPRMHQTYDLAFKAAPVRAPILIHGESGTGKSTLARVIHERSPQAKGSFVTVSCEHSCEPLERELFGTVKEYLTGAVVDTIGKVAEADGGTLYIDGVCALPLKLQPKLVRLLKEKEYERVGETKARRADVRVVSSTNGDLEQKFKDGQFDLELCRRLTAISIWMPPFRNRLADLPRIVMEWLRFLSKRWDKDLAGFPPAAWHALQTYSWPGNLSELRTVLEHSAMLAEKSEIGLNDLPPHLHPPEQQ